VGNQPIPNAVGTFGEDCINRNGQTLREFASFNDFKIANTFFRKKEIHKYTWSARGFKSIIDYVIVNRRLKNLVQDTKIFQGYDIGSDHFLVTCRINLLSRWKQQSNNSRLTNELVYKIYLLQEESIRSLYQQRLAKTLSEYPMASTIDKEWENIKISIKKAANEAIGTKTKYRRKKGLRIWNEEIRNVIANKRTAYQIYLQNPSEENFETYKIRRNIAKTIVSKTHKESWDRFISRIETDIFGEQSMAYKVLKHLNRTNKDTIEINNIEDQKWINHYKDLWCTNSLQNDNDDPETTSATSTGIDEISDEELEQSLKSMKNRKAPGPDGLNSELFKYGDTSSQTAYLSSLTRSGKKDQLQRSGEKLE